MTVEKWLSAPEMADFAGVTRQAAAKLMARAIKGHPWRGHVLEVRTKNGRGGRAGLSYEVSLRSLSAALPAPPAVVAPPLPSLPSRSIVSARSPAVERRWRMIEPAADTAPGSAERTAAVAAILAGPNAPAASTLRRTLALYDAHGWAGLADAKRSNAGEARVVVSRVFDQAFRAAGHADAKLRKIGAELEQLRKDIWASPVRRAGNFEVRRRLQHELGKLCERFSTPVPEAAQRVSRRWVEVDRAWGEIDIFKHDAKRFHDSMPHIIRDNLAGRPMDRIVADVKHLDVVLTRPDGSQVWPKVVGFLDEATGRVFLYPVMLERGEGVRQEHVIEGFLAMVQVWGMPQGLYLDNGSEFSCFERISHYFALINETAGKPISYAKAYNAKAKYIEGVFKRLDQYLFKLMPGYTGSDRMNKKTAQVGRPTQPYSGDWAQFCEQLAVSLAVFNARPIGGQWAGRSADAVYAEHVAAGWRPITVDVLVLDAAFSERTTRRLDRGGVKLDGVRHWHPAFTTARAGSLVEIAKSWRRGADPLFRIEHASDWAYMEPELRFHPQDKHGAREAGRRGRDHVKAVKKRAATVRPYDPLAVDRELAAKAPGQVLPFQRGRIGGQSRDRAIAAGPAQAAAERATREAEADRRKRQDDAYEAALREIYG